MNRLNKNDSRPTISKYAIYDIDELIQIWKSGWENLAIFYKNRSGGTCMGLGDSTEPVELRIQRGFAEIFETCVHCYDPEFSTYDILCLAAIADNAPQTGWKKLYDLYPKIEKSECCFTHDYIALNKTYEKIFTAFEKSKTLNDVFLKLKKIEALKYHYKGRYAWFDTGDDLKDFRNEEDFNEVFNLLLSTPITDVVPRFMKWLKYGLQGKKQCDEAFWNCVWIMAESYVEDLRNIKKKLNKDIPLDEVEYYFLRSLIKGNPKLEMVANQNGTIEYEMSLDILRPKMENMDAIKCTGDFLLPQPAFILANQLQLKPPRFIQTCHAPSCGKKFYTSRDIQKTCSRTTHSGRRSNCKARWESYQKWLRKIGKNPDEVWNDPKLKKQYLDQHFPRGPQTKA